MEGKGFSEIGKVEAIKMLYEGSSFSQKKEIAFNPEDKSKILSVSRIFIEGIDFSLVYFPLKHLGYKVITALTGELYASLSHPRELSIRIGVSSKLDFDHIKELWSGMVSAAREHEYIDVDLDLSPSCNGLIISVSATGELYKGTSVRIPKAKSKDLICVSGSLGGAYLGMKVLEREMEKFEKTSKQPDLDQYKMIVGDYLKPEINPSILSQFEETGIIPSCGILVRNGLADAVKRLAHQTSLGAKIYATQIPFEGNSFELGKKLDIDPISAAMNGGDDFRLLFTIPILALEDFRHDFQTFSIIGHLALPEVKEVLVTPEGLEMPLKAQGWNNDESEQLLNQ